MSGPMTSSWPERMMAGRFESLIIDEFTRECLALVVARQLRSDDVMYCLAELFVDRGPPDHIRSDNGSEFAAHAVRDWLGKVGVKTLFIEPGAHLGRTATAKPTEDAGREAERRDILHTLQGSPGRSGNVASGVQYNQAAQFARTTSTSAGRHPAPRAGVLP